MASKDELGKAGEKAARIFLIQKGYIILETNWRYRHKEIDIIARDGNEVVIVEVKTREEGCLEEPWTAVSNKKIRNLVTAANAWIQKNRIDFDTRFDVISIVYSGPEKFDIKHFPKAFLPPVY
jgi:putative endonuclease